MGFTECFFLFRDGEEGCKKQLGRVLSIWQERAVYENNLLDQLSQVLCKLSQQNAVMCFFCLAVQNMINAADIKYTLNKFRLHHVIVARKTIQM